jgi:hypothetical protein
LLYKLPPSKWINHFLIKVTPLLSVRLIKIKTATIININATNPNNIVATYSQATTSDVPIIPASKAVLLLGHTLGKKG